MCKTVRRAFLLVSAITSTAIASEAIAAQRTFVSGAGSDANPCSLSQPCRSLGAAIALVSAGGEVVVLDSAGYGPVTISQSVSITAPSGVYAGITSSGGSGISISGSNLHVTLRGLTVNSLGGTDGVDVFTDNSEVRIERCTMHGFTHEGLRMAGVNLHVHVEDSEVSANQIGVFAQDGALVHLERVSITENSGAGLAMGVAVDNNAAEVVVRDSVIGRNGTGIDAIVFGNNRTHKLLVDRTVVAGNAQVGISTGSGSAASSGFATVTRSTAANNGSFGVRAVCVSGGTQQLTVEDSAISDNGSSGIQGGGAGCTVTAGRNTIVRNSVGLDNSGATFTSFQNNELSSNTTMTLGTIGVAPFN